MLDDTLHNLPVGRDPQPRPDPDDDPPPYLRFEEIDIENGRMPALFSYVGALFCFPIALVPLLRRDNAYALHHARQALTIWILVMDLVILLGFTRHPLVLLPLPLLWIAAAIGWRQVSQDDPDPRPIPGISALAQTWFGRFVPRPDPDDL